MDIARILVVQESAKTSQDLCFTSFDHPVEFSFCTPDQVIRGELDLSPYIAIVASLDSEHRPLVDSLREDPGDGPPIFLFRSEPPLREIARWVTWGKVQDGTDPAVAVRLLSESMEYYSLASLYQQCLKIMACQDEEKMLARISETFTNVLGTESCVIWVAAPRDPDEMVIASVRGCIGISREGSTFSLSQADWAEGIGNGKPFLHPPGETEREGSRSDGGVTDLYVPILHLGKPVGLVKLGARPDRKPFGQRDMYVASIIAGYAAMAWKNITRFVRMERVSLRDAETRAYSPVFLSDYFEKERYKAGRFRRPLSAVFLVLDNLSRIREETRETVVAGAISDMIDAIGKVLRESDLIARVEANRFCAILPETDYFGSLLALRRLRKAIRESTAIQYLGTEYRLETFLVSVTFPRDGKDLPGLWRVAEAKYHQQKQSPFHRLHLREKTLWNAFDTLVGKPDYYDLLRSGQTVPYFSRFQREKGRNGHFCLKRETFLRMMESVAQDVMSLDRKRGLVIAAGPRPEMFKQIFLSPGPEAGNGRSITIIGQDGNTRFDSKNLLYVHAEDQQLQDRQIVMFLKENGAYGLLATEREDEVCGFNTADEWLVDSMIEKVQETYRLQGTF